MQTEENNSAIQALEDEYNQLIQRADGIRVSIDILKRKQSNGQRNNGSDKPSEYDSEASNKAKVWYFIKKYQRFLHIREMADMAHQVEPNVTSEDFLKRFSPALSALKKDEVLVNIKIGKSLVNTFWGSDKWLMNDGISPKRGHEPNQEYVTDGANAEYEL